jgi:D-xylose transport system permease protein
MSALSTTTPQETVLNKVMRQLRGNLQTYALVIALIVIWGLFAFLTNGTYLSPQNISNLFRQMTITAIMSVGMVLVIVHGSIDLSVGRLAGFVSVVVATLQLRTWEHYFPGQPLLATILSVICGIGVGTLYGIVQGWIIAYLRVTSFIVTLGSMWILNGAILIVTVGRTIAANQEYFEDIGQGYLDPSWGWAIAAAVVVVLFVTMILGRRRKAKYGFALPSMVTDILKTLFFSLLMVGYVVYVNQYRGFQNPVLILALVVVVVSYMADNTRFGRHVYAIGGNREASRLSGINIQRTMFQVFVLMGFLCGIAGVVMASYVGYGTIAAGTGYELYVIAGCILGGTSTLGGVGTIFGAMVGSLIMASVTNGLQIMNVPSSWQYVVNGLVLVVAVYMDVQFKKNR